MSHLVQASQERFSINKYPLFIMGVFAHAKNGDEQFSKGQQFHATNGGLSMYLKCLDFFSFKFWIGVVVFLIFLVFPICSFQVPNMFPKGVPNSTSLLSHMFCPSPPLLTFKLGGPKERHSVLP